MAPGAQHLSRHHEPLIFATLVSWLAATQSKSNIATAETMPWGHQTSQLLGNSCFENMRLF